MKGDQVADNTQVRRESDYPLRGTRAQVMLEAAMKAAQASGRSQRDVAADLGYRTSVVLSHMSTGRVPIPIDRAKDMAAALDMNGDSFLLAVLEQRLPHIDWKSLFNISFSSGRTVGRLEAIAGGSLDDLPAETRSMLEEVVAARNPARRWLAPAELTTVELIRELRPESRQSGLSDEDRRSIEKALRPS
jgi:hypothetical protein